MAGGRITAAGTDDEVLAQVSPETQRIDLKGRRVIPGLNDSHLHVVRAGLFYNLELRWDGVPTLSQAMEQIKEQARRTPPPPQWVRVMGGWNEFQFAEGRLPSLDEINKAAPDTPVFLLHLYDCALLNRAALRALGMDESTPNPPGGLICRDASEDLLPGRFGVLGIGDKFQVSFHVSHSFGVISRLAGDQGRAELSLRLEGIGLQCLFVIINRLYRKFWI